MNHAGPLRIGIDNISPGESTAPGAPGGMRRYLQVLTTLLPQAAPAAEFRVFSPYWNADLGPMPPRVEVVGLRGVPQSRSARIFFQQTSLVSAAQRAGVDVFVAAATIAPLRLAMPTVLVVQFLQFYAFPQAYGRARTTYLRWMLPASVKRAAQVIVFTEFQRRELLAHVSCDASRVAVVPHGIDYDVFATPASDGALREARALAGSRPFLLYVSATYGYKNHRGLIDAFAVLKRRRAFPHVLLLAGSEQAVPFRELRAHAATRGVARDVIFCGRLADVTAAYQAADAFVFPSLYETFGFPVLEAMAAGCPVIASDLGATAELCGDAAALANPADSDALASAIERVLDDASYRATLVANGRARAAGFTWQRTAALTYGAIQRAAKA